FLFASGTHRNVARIRGINRYEGKGVSYCAVCDAFFYRNKTVAVLGHSEYAASEVSELVEVCDTVYVLTNGQKIDAEFDARAIIVEDKILQVSGEDKVEKVHFEDHDLDVSGIFVA